MASLRHVLCSIAMLLACLSGGALSKTARCDVQPDSATPVASQEPVTGTVQFTQNDASSETTVSVNLSGFNVSDNYTSHGFHVHETGDVTSGCSGTGGHYNPTNVAHGDRTANTRHVGDLGNLIEAAGGTCVTSFTDSVVSLEGAHSIIGRAIVIHQKEDDLGLGDDSGSVASGNAGSRIACCVIMDTSDGESIFKSRSWHGLILLVGFAVVSFVTS